MTKPTREQAYDEMLKLISSLLGWYEDGERAPLADTLYDDCADPETWEMTTKRIHAMAREAKNTADVPVNQMGQKMPQPSAEVPGIVMCNCGSTDVTKLDSFTAHAGVAVYRCNTCHVGFSLRRDLDKLASNSITTPLSSIQSAIASVVSDLELTQENRGNYDITSGHLISVLKLLAVAIDKEMAK